MLIQLADVSLSIDEVKDLACELKRLRPVQKIISAFLGKNWEDIEKDLGEDVTPSLLQRFVVSMNNCCRMRI